MVEYLYFGQKNTHLMNSTIFISFRFATVRHLSITDKLKQKHAIYILRGVCTEIVYQSFITTKSCIFEISVFHNCKGLVLYRPLLKSKQLFRHFEFSFSCQEVFCYSLLCQKIFCYDILPLCIYPNSTGVFIIYAFVKHYLGSAYSARY